MAGHRRVGLLLLAWVGLVTIAGCVGPWTGSVGPRWTAMSLDPADWAEHAANPVFGQAIGGPKAYYPCVIYDESRFSGHGTSALYKMWYGASGGQTALAVSEDGLAWTDLGVVLPAGYHTTVKYNAAGFPGSGPDVSTMRYRAWYWDPAHLYSVNALAYAESPDGENWTNLQPCQNGPVPIVSNGDPWWNRGSYGPCDVLIDPSASNTGTDWVFTLYYDGTTGGDEAIGLAFSADGITWTGYDENGDGKADPVFTGTYIAGDWDHDYTSRATILVEEDGSYAMWYSGGTGAVNHGIGYATSPDGIHWTRSGVNPVFHRDDGVTWRSDRTYCPSVVPVDGGVAMWFAGKGADGYSIGLATLIPEVITVPVDIKPETGENTINLGSKGVLPVAVLGSAALDVSEIDPSSVRLAEAAPLRWHTEDVNADGLPDLFFHFPVPELALDSTSTDATLVGQTTDGTPIAGSDDVTIVPKKKP